MDFVYVANAYSEVYVLVTDVCSSLCICNRLWNTKDTANKGRCLIVLKILKLGPRVQDIY